MAKHSLGVPGGLIALDFRRSGVCAAEIEENRPSTCGKDGFSSTQSAEAPKKGTMRGYRRELDPRYDQPARTMCPTIAQAGEVLRQRRKELGWTVEFAAATCSINPRTISELERGIRQVGYDTVALYAQNMGVDIIFQIRGKS